MTLRCFVILDPVPSAHFSTIVPHTQAWWEEESRSSPSPPPPPSSLPPNITLALLTFRRNNVLLIRRVLRRYGALSKSTRLYTPNSDEVFSWEFSQRSRPGQTRWRVARELMRSCLDRTSQTRKNSHQNLNQFIVDKSARDCHKLSSSFDWTWFWSREEGLRL